MGTTPTPLPEVTAEQDPPRPPIIPPLSAHVCDPAQRFAGRRVILKPVGTDTLPTFFDASSMMARSASAKRSTLSEACMCFSHRSAIHTHAFAYLLRSDARVCYTLRVQHSRTVQFSLRLPTVRLFVATVVSRAHTCLHIHNVSRDGRYVSGVSPPRLTLTRLAMDIFRRC